jgi:pimeloyl-ACP methyl ester carboxylesterase
MDIKASNRLESGILERRFTVAGAGGRPVPGVLWSNETSAGPTPLILLGHGGSGSKEAAGNLQNRDYFTGRHGVATAAIDGPVHGERGGVESILDPRYAEMWRTPGVMDDMSADWRCTLDALLGLGEFDPGAVGYFGLSMGTMFGLSYVASEPRIAAAVLGKCGLAGTSIDRSQIAARLAADAPRLACPVVFHVQWDDERFDRDSAFELYGLIGSADKRLQSIPGPHGGSTPEATETLRTFLISRLLAAPAKQPTSAK